MTHNPGTIAIITGGSYGIGLGIAQRLANEGYQVVITARGKQRLDDAVDLLNKNNPQYPALGLLGDASKLADVERVCGEVVERFGKIGVLVNNAGQLEHVPLEGSLQKAEQLFDDIVGSSLKGAYLMSHACIPHLATPGRIINMGSIVAHTGGGRGYTAYAAAKAGMHGLTLALASELGPREVTVNTIAPGFIGATGMSEEMTDEHTAALTANIPLRRPGLPADVAGAVAWLASSDASYVSGMTLPVNGGWCFYT